MQNLFHEVSEVMILVRWELSQFLIRDLEYYYAHYHTYSITKPRF